MRIVSPRDNSVLAYSQKFGDCCPIASFVFYFFSRNIFPWNGFLLHRSGYPELLPENCEVVLHNCIGSFLWLYLYTGQAPANTFFKGSVFNRRQQVSGQLFVSEIFFHFLKQLS
jgi:hypothetical protein